MTGRIAVLALAIGFLAAPLAGGAGAGACPPCCPRAAHVSPETPCHAGDSPCVSLAASPCCHAAPVAPASQARRSAEPPSLPLVPSAAHPAALASWRARAPRAPADLALLTSPLRLSVVLLT